jgi:pyruvate dehydrogenase E2 component (dihydrolipoamide acetyltransferase)
LRHLVPDVVMPRLSDSMEEGTILRWLKQDGDEVAAGDELAEIETDKATMTYEAESAGVLRIVAREGDTLP